MTMMEESVRPCEVYEWIDREGLRRWLEAEGFTPTDLPEKFQRWFTGGRIDGPKSVWDVDELLVILDRHLVELPDDIWLEERPPRRRRHYDPETRAKVVAEYHAGVEAKELEAKYDVSRDIIIKWSGRRQFEFNAERVADFVCEQEGYPLLSQGDRSTVSGWRRRRKNPQVRSVRRILAVLGLSLEHLPSDCWSKVSAHS